MRKRSCLCSLAGLFALGVALLVVGLVFALSVIPKDLDARAKKDYVFGTNADGTLNDFTRRWRWRVDSLGNSDSHLEVYMYNYSNVLDVLDLGLRPDVVEVGPYTYRILTDVVSESSENGTFTFSKRRSFIFDAERSCSGCSPQDQFLVPDPIFFGVFVQVGSVEKITEICRQLGDKCQPDLKKLLSSIPSLIGMAVDVFGRYGPFVNVKVHEIVFDGWKDPLYDKVMKSVLAIVAFGMNGLQDKNTTLPFDEPKFHFQINSSETTFTVATGDGDYLQNGQIIRFETSANVSSGVGTLPEAWWNVTRDDCDPEEARSLYGTDGDVFHPLMEESESLAMFVEELCRPVRLSFQKKAPLFGLESLRFALSTDTFDYSAPENCGFCVPLEASFYGGSQNESCLPDGLLDLSQCRSLPMVASNPHFFEAAPEVKKLFPRTVRKTRDREVITVDVEPKSGTVLRMNKRLQYNVLFQNFPDVPSFSVMRSGVYPMFWVNETYSIGDANLQTLKEDLFSPVATWKLVCYIAGVGLGGLFIVLSLLAGLCTILRSRKESRRIHITSASAPTSSRVVPSSEGASPTLRNRRH